MAEKKEPVFWCDCIYEVMGFAPKMERALGILRWAEGKGYKRPTSGAIESLKDARKDLDRVIWHCRLDDKVVEASNMLAQAMSGDVSESVKLVEDANRLVRNAISDECRKQRMERPPRPLRLLPKE